MLKFASPINQPAAQVSTNHRDDRVSAFSVILARRAGPFWRRHASELTRVGSISALICLAAFLFSVASSTSLIAAKSDDSADAAKMFLVGCLKLIALARLYEACCRLSRLGANRWIGPAAVLTMACCPLFCLRLALPWINNSSSTESSNSNYLCRPTELAAYYVLLLDLNCLFRAAASAAAVGTSDAEDKDSGYSRLDKAIAVPVLSMATGYAIKGAGFFIGGRVAANLSPELRQVCHTMALTLITCACLHLVLLPGYLVRLASSGPPGMRPKFVDAAASYYYQYYGSRKQEIKAMMVAGVLLLQSLGGGAASSVGSDNLIGRLCSWLASPAWDLCLALPYCIYLCIQFAVCEQHPAASQPDSGDCGAIFSAKADGGAVKVGAAIDNSADANIGADKVGAKLIGAAGDVSIGARGGESDANGETREPVQWRKRVLSESSSSGLAPFSRQTQLRQQLSAPAPAPAQRQRSLEEALQLLRRDGGSVAGCLSNADYLNLMQAGHVKPRQLEGLTGCPNRAVELRRLHLAGTLVSAGTVLTHIPFQDYDWKQVTGRCCEEVIGLATLPLGLVGPLLVNGMEHRLPLATTEGCLVASVNRGCAVLRAAGGCRASVYRDGMTRAPLLEFPSAVQAVRCMQFAESEAGQTLAASAFEATSSHCRLRSLACFLSGRRLHLRYCAETGDAMGMNMLSKGAEAAVSSLLSRFPEARLVSLSGNACSDKKPTAVNWILGRGKSVVCETRLPESLVRSTLRVSPASLVALNQAKNLEGSSLAGTVGGFNAHAANLAAAVFIACGQDPAQVVEASQAITCLEVLDDGSGDLYASVTMPCLEVGVVGGGTHLPTQRACLRLVGLPEDQPAACLAQVICAGVLCAEISLLAALANQELVASHMKLNRSKQMHHAPS
uniref:3-hydroxy-3-methylglutaryl-coenzyme A reductase n=2 Tax=Macrostomum lignano TaxID=282301 RepID=A0A1I8GMC7_9PLAT